MQLTEIELVLLLCLLRQAGNICDSISILEELYPPAKRPGGNIIKVLICKIRQKLVSIGIGTFILTHRGKGYSVPESRNIWAGDNSPNQLQCAEDYLSLKPGIPIRFPSFPSAESDELMGQLFARKISVDFLLASYPEMSSSMLGERQSEWLSRNPVRFEGK